MQICFLLFQRTQANLKVEKKKEQLLFTRAFISFNSFFFSFSLLSCNLHKNMRSYLVNAMTQLIESKGDNQISVTGSYDRLMHK